MMDGELSLPLGEFYVSCTLYVYQHAVSLQTATLVYHGGW